jgi:hypothetical protein
MKLDHQATAPQLSMEEKLATLNQAPTHAQDRDAVRDAMNSFRDVANYSARMAIARHSMKHQKTDLLFKGILTSVCVLTTLIIFAESIWGAKTLGIIKWAALAVSITSSAQFLRGLLQVKQLFPDKSNLESSAEEAQVNPQTATEPAAVTELVDFQDEPDTLEQSNSFSADEEPLSADEEELQSLEAQLLENSRRKRRTPQADADHVLQDQPDFETDAEP